MAPNVASCSKLGVKIIIVNSMQMVNNFISRFFSFILSLTKKSPLFPMKQLTAILLIFLFFSCQKETSKKISQGMWLGQLQVNDQERLPFNFEVTSDSTLKIFNADEVILVNDMTYQKDSVIIKMPVYEGYIVAKIKDKEMVGRFVKESLGRSIPFKAIYDSHKRFEANKAAEVDISGEWETVFNPNSEADRYLAKGIFEQNGQKVTGTFSTATGDYRYLEGIIDGKELKLSTFDGANAYLFTATVQDSTLKGIFYSGNHWSAPFEAKRNSDFELADENELTFLKDGFERLEFSFPESDGTMMSLNDERFKDKVVVVQLMGTWCPNCLDESKYFSEFYKNNSEKEIAFVALAFEYAKTEAKAFESIARLKDRIGIEYPVLLAQYGTSDKIEAQKKLPMLNHVLSYPTTIFIDKTGSVRKIHTGFNGPATGEKYDDFKKEFEGFIDELLAE